MVKVPNIVFGSSFWMAMSVECLWMCKLEFCGILYENPVYRDFEVVLMHYMLGFCVSACNAMCE